MTCNNCKSEFNGNYCQNCGQKHLERHTYRSALIEILGELDFRRGVIITLFRIFINPSRLISEYLSGATKKYVHPFALLVICIGFFFLLSEIEVFPFAFNIGGQFELITLLLVGSVPGSILVGYIRRVDKTPIEMVIINTYLICGLIIIFILVELYFNFEWVYHLNNNQLIKHSRGYFKFLVVIFLIWYLASVFNKRIDKIFINLIFLILSFTIFFLVSDFIENNDEKRLPEFSENVRTWVLNRMYKNPRLKSFSIVDIQNSLLEEDLTGDEVRDYSILLTDKNDNKSLALFRIKSFDYQIIHFQDYGISSDVLEIKTSGNDLHIRFKNSINAKIFWDGDNFRFQRIDK